MLVFDKNRFGSKREIDEANGYLRVTGCNITKSQIRPYYGKEIPGWRDFELDPDTIYNVYCPEEELKKALESFNNLPLTREHIEVDVENVPKDKIVGSLGDHAEYKRPYVKNNLIVYDKKDIDWILSGKKKELSCGYRYTPVRQSGEFDGKHYDFLMTDIIGNHVALVREGRAGHDVMVADENLVCDYNKNHDSDGRFGFGKVIVSGDELGGKELSLKELREKAQEYYKDNLAGNSETNKNLGEVFFSLRGYKHPIAFSTRKEKLLLFPHLRQIIKSGAVSGPFPDIHGNDKNRWYKITTTVDIPDSLGNQTEKGVIVHVRQDANGKLYYDHTIKIPTDDRVRLKMNGLNGRSTEENKLTSDTDIIPQEEGLVNIFFVVEEELPNFTESQNDNTINTKENEMLTTDEFKEADHPRDDSGRFTEKSGSSSGKSLKDDKDVENYWQNTGSKESQGAGVVKVMKKQLEDLKAEHKKIFGKSMFVSKEEQERGEMIGKQIKDLEDEIAKKESDGSEKKEESSKEGEILKTKGLMEHLQKSVEAQKAENPDAKIGDTYIDSDRYLSLFGDTLSPKEYESLDWDKAEKVIFNKLREMEKEAGFKGEMAKDKEIPEKAGKPEKAGDEVALNQGETKMAEEVKEAPAEKKVEETKKEEVVEDACKKAEDKKEVKPACDEKEDKRKLIDEIGGILKDKLSEEDWRTVIKKAEELAYNDSERSADDKKLAKDEDKKDLKGKEQKAFAEGVEYGEKKEKAEPKKLDSEHESEGMKKAEKEMAKDSALAMDIDAIKAQVREEVMADFKAREEARKAVRGFVGDVNVMAFDSAEDIYKFACGKSGMDLNEIVSFKDAFKGLSAGKSKALALDASPVSGSNEECFKDIRIE